MHAQVLFNPRVEKIAEGFQFVEGPVWVDDLGLLFSDIPANRVYLWTETAGATVYIEPSGNSNGLALDADGRLMLAQHGLRQVARHVNDTFEVVASEYNGMKLNSPNDLAIHSDGSVFFTDPPYGLPQGVPSETGFFGIYRAAPDGRVTLLDSTLFRPNGIAFSPDETKLYVTDTESRRVYEWDMVSDSTVSDKRELAFMQPSSSGADGMKVDPEGFLYVTGPVGIWIFSPEGEAIDTIPVPGQTTNCAWGNADRQTLYVTSGNAVYRIFNDEGPDHVEADKVKALSIRSHPNPFSHSVDIELAIHESGRVKIDIFDLKGVKLVSLINDFLHRGRHIFSWNSLDHPAGYYFIKAGYKNGQVQVFKIQKI